MSFIPEVCEQKRDEILDKINEKGIHSMTASERYFLDNFDEICKNHSKNHQASLSQTELQDNSDDVIDLITYELENDNVKIVFQPMFDYDKPSFETGKILKNFFCFIMISTSTQDMSFTGKIICANNVVLGLDLNAIGMNGEIFEYDDNLRYLPIEAFYSAEIINDIKNILQEHLNENAF